MSEPSCSACGHPLEGDASPAGYCANCGGATINAEPARFIEHEFDLREIARRQRRVLLAIMSSFAVPFALAFLISLADALPPGSRSAFADVNLLIFSAWMLFILIAALRLQAAHGAHIAVLFFTCLLLLAPCGNLFILLAINMEAIRILREAGLRVSFTGLSDEEVQRQIGTHHCRGCGYLLIGNTSGICPECGLAILPAQLGNIPTEADHV